MHTLRIAMAQIRVDPGRVDVNLGRAESMISRAAAEGCDIALLPECLDVGWTNPAARDLAEPIPGRTFERLAAAAKCSNVYVIAGLTERAGDRIYNAAVLISPTGNLLYKHRKLNELDIAHDLYTTGDSLGVASTPLGAIGISICADNFPDTIVFAHSQARMGAQILLSPSSWAVEADHDNTKEPYGGLWLGSYTHVAKTFGIPVIGVSNVGPITAGPWRGRKCIGCSLAVGRDGTVLAWGPYGEDAEGMIVVDVPLAPLRSLGTEVSKRLRAEGHDPESLLGAVQEKREASE